MSKHLLFKRPTNVDTPTGFFIDYVSTLTDGAWPIAITFISFSVIYLSLNRFGPKKAYGAASFTSFVVVTMLVALGAFDSGALVIALLLVVLGVVINRGETR